MNQKPWLVAILAFAGTVNGNATVVFSEDFSSSSTLNDYVNASNPNSGQWNDISTGGSGATVNIVNNALQYGRTGNNSASFTRTTLFSPAPTALIYTLNLTASPTAPATTAATWYVGSGFSFGNTAPTVSTSVNSRFSVEFNSDGTYCLRVSGSGGATSSPFSSGTSLALTWVINDSGGDLSYHGPDGSTDAVGNGAWDLWAGNTLIFNDIAADNPSLRLTQLKFFFGAGDGTITMDNLQIQSVPEPVCGAAFAGALVVLCGFSTLRQLAEAICFSQRPRATSCHCHLL